MNKLSALGAVILGVGGLLLAAVGTATAAPDVVGKTYADAVAALQQSGSVVVVAARVGDQLPLDECIVEGVSSPPFVRPGSGAAVRNEVRLTVNCNGSVAKADTPGNSAASPAGQRAIEEQKNAEWRRSPEGQEWCEQAQKMHPDWFPIEGC